MKNKILFIERIGVSNLYNIGVQIHSSRKICFKAKVQNREGMIWLDVGCYKFKNEEECEKDGYLIC